VGVQAVAHQRVVAELVTFPITRHQLVEAACLATGLDHFGEPSWAEGLDRLLEDLERNADLNELGMSIVESEFTSYPRTGSGSSTGGPAIPRWHWAR